MAAINTDKLGDNNLILVMSLVTLVVLALTGIVSKFLVSGIILDTKVVAAKSKADDQLKKNLVSAPKLVEEFAALGTDAGVLADALPATADFPSLLVAVENMGLNAGLQLRAVTPSSGGATLAPVASAAGTAPVAQKYSFAVTFGGRYDSLQRFLTNVQTYARPLRVTSIQLSGTGSSLGGAIEFETYYQGKASLPIGTEIIK